MNLGLLDTVRARSVVPIVLLCVIPLMPAHAQMATAQSVADLRSEIDRVLDTEDFANAFWGLHVVELNTGDTLYYLNDGKSFIPASHTKIYTTSAALDIFG